MKFPATSSTLPAVKLPAASKQLVPSSLPGLQQQSSQPAAPEQPLPPVSAPARSPSPSQEAGSQPAAPEQPAARPSSSPPSDLAPGPQLSPRKPPRPPGSPQRQLSYQRQLSHRTDSSTPLRQSSAEPDAWPALTRGLGSSPPGDGSAPATQPAEQREETPPRRSVRYVPTSPAPWPAPQQASLRRRPSADEEDELPPTLAAVALIGSFGEIQQ